MLIIWNEEKRVQAARWRGLTGRREGGEGERRGDKREGEQGVCGKRVRAEKHMRKIGRAHV